MMLCENIVTVPSYLPTCSDLGAPAWHSSILCARSLFAALDVMVESAGNILGHRYRSLPRGVLAWTDPAHSFPSRHARVLAQTGWSSGNSMSPMGATAGGGPDLPCIIVTLGIGRRTSVRTTQTLIETDRGNARPSAMMSPRVGARLWFGTEINGSLLGAE